MDSLASRSTRQWGTGLRTLRTTRLEGKKEVLLLEWEGAEGEGEGEGEGSPSCHASKTWVVLGWCASKGSVVDWSIQ